MSRSHVRVSPAAPTRRRPSQSRARVSAEALQEAFVRVLLERGYAGVTVREVAAVAGVGVGTFYEYAANMRGLAALTIHLRVKALALKLQASVQAMRGLPLMARIEAMVGVQLDHVLADAPAWAALFHLEREISGVDAYRKQYEQYVEIWRQALGADAPPERVGAMARLLHSLAYGAVTQALLTQGPAVDQQALRAELLLAMRGYLAACSAGAR